VQDSSCPTDTDTHRHTFCSQERWERDREGNGLEATEGYLRGNRQLSAYEVANNETMNKLS